MDFAQQEQISPDALSHRTRSLAEETGFQDLVGFADRLGNESIDDLRDALSTRFMEVYRDTASPQAFSLIYELNQRTFFVTVLGRLRRSHYLVDANDILQEVFVNIYRYPHRFKADRPQAFRYWASTIIRNTVLRFLKGNSKGNHTELILEEAVEPADDNQLPPSELIVEDEANTTCRHAWMLYLKLYLEEYNRLNSRERQSLHLVEVEGFSYREVSAEMDIKIENLKMVIFRARRKIIKSMKKRLDSDVSATCEVSSK